MIRILRMWEWVTDVVERGAGDEGDEAGYGAEDGIDYKKKMVVEP